MSCDLKQFFMEPPMSRAEYMRIHSKYFPPDIRYRYQIEGLISADGYLCIKIIKGMYGLKQAAIISWNQSISHMEPHGYYLVPFTTGLWSHKTRNVFLLMCGWFWSEIFFQRWCKSSSRFPKKVLCNFKGLGGTQLPRIYNILELKQWICWHINARICKESAG